MWCEVAFFADFDTKRPSKVQFPNHKAHCPTVFHDVGVSEWIFEVDETSGEELWSRLQELQRDPVASGQRVRTVMAGVDEQQRRMVEV